MYVALLALCTGIAVLARTSLSYKRAFSVEEAVQWKKPSR